MAYLGLVPSERSTGEQVRRGSITKAGNPRARRVLIEGAWSLSLSGSPEPAPGPPGPHQDGSLPSTASAQDVHSESGWLASAAWYPDL